MLQVAKVDGILLTRVETNISPGGTCTAALVYCHGFPDASVTPNAFEEAKQAPDAPPEHGFWASRFPRKVCEHVLGKFSDVAFLAFNSRGIPGSSSGEPPGRVEDPPPDFEAKNLSGDMQDIASVARFAAEQFPGAKIIMCGFSTGAFLALAFTARPEMHPASGIAACFVLASVSDIPSSSSLDFSPEQLARFEAEGFCLARFFPHGGTNNPQLWKLGRGYLDSYASFPDTKTLAASLRAPVLLLQGSDDTAVPPWHAQTLLEALTAGSGESVEVVMLKKGNHFLSANAALRSALSAVSAFLLRNGLSPSL